MKLQKEWLWLWYGSRYVLRGKMGKITKKNLYPKYKRTFLDIHAASEEMIQKIQSGKPFMAARIGYNEMSMMKAFDYEKKSKYPDVMKNMCDVAGFFPYDYSLGNRFLETMEDSMMQTDVLAVMNTPFEDYYINNYLPEDAIVTPFDVMNFWLLKNSWTKALAGKKVLVVHPFVDTIQKQYAKRELLFPKHQLLPEFELITYQAIQTAGGEEDNRFATWFDALNYMCDGISKIDFDIAIIGCGAYGFPIAAHIKKMGKQAIHMGGVSQILFGIKGNRWIKKKSSVAPFINDDWAWPSMDETPKNVNIMEGGPYFQAGNYLQLERGKDE